MHIVIFRKMYLNLPRWKRKILSLKYEYKIFYLSMYSPVMAQLIGRSTVDYVCHVVLGSISSRWNCNTSIKDCAFLSV